MSFLTLLKGLFNSNKNEPNRTANVQPVQETPKHINTGPAENNRKNERILVTGYLSHSNDKNRQEALSKCIEGEPITFNVLEYKKGDIEIEVYTTHGCIGTFYSKGYQTIARYILNGGTIHDAKITFLNYPKTSRGKITGQFSFERNKMR